MPIHTGYALSMVHNVYQTAKDTPARTLRDKSPELPTDKVELSKESQTFQSILQRLKEGNNVVRADKVAFYSAAIANGSYHVEAKEIAARMLNLGV